MTDGIEGDGELVTLNAGQYIVFDAALVHTGSASTRDAAIAGEKHTDLGIHFYLADDLHEPETAGGEEPSYPVFPLFATASGGDRAGVVQAALTGAASISGEQLGNASTSPLPSIASSQPSVNERPYEGEKDAEGKRHGHGTLTSPDGNKYEGEWVHGEQHSQGTLTTSHGTYEGGWANGKKHGQGELSYKDEKWCGEFANNELVSGTHTKEGRTDTGEFGDERKYHGHGVRETPGMSTVRLEGNWDNGRALGVMDRTLPNGNTIKQGYYVNDLRLWAWRCLVRKGSKARPRAAKSSVRLHCASLKVKEGKVKEGKVKEGKGQGRKGQGGAVPFRGSPRELIRRVSQAAAWRAIPHRGGSAVCACPP